MTNNTLSSETDVRRVAFLGNYLPRRCGIATFTTDIFKSFQSEYPDAEGFVVAVTDRKGEYDYPGEVRFEFQEQDESTYIKAADFLNAQNPEIVCLQHEYGIFGGNAGEYILTLLQRLKMPIVTTLHTILKDPNDDQRRVMMALSNVSSRLIVMSQMGKQILMDTFGISEEVIDINPHGIPDMPFVDPHFYKNKFHLEDKKVILTFGLLGPNKGIENVIRALPKVAEQYPDFIYLIVGATHPNLIRHEGEKYREGIAQLALDLGVEDKIRFVNDFLELEDLKELIGAADIYFTPYLFEAQITSGTLAYAFGCGKAVISTPYWHAKEMLADGKGILVPFNDPEAIATSLVDLLTNDSYRNNMRLKAYMAGRDTTWSNVIQKYSTTFSKARIQRNERKQLEYNLSPNLDLPEINLEHLINMTDSTGLFQHARYNFPNFKEGYCTDDNARALILTIMLEKLGFEHSKLSWLKSTYAAYIDYAFNEKSSSMHNFMSFDRKWMEISGSDDSHGKTVWATGFTIANTKDPDLKAWAMLIFERIVRQIPKMTSPRGWAFAMLGIHYYNEQFQGDLQVSRIQIELANRLAKLYKAVATDDWCWFEENMTYDNALLSHAMLTAGADLESEEFTLIGLKTLTWHMSMQTAPNGYFRPIGNNGFWKKGSEVPFFDQQPLEAQCAITTCLAAYKLTQDIKWKIKAETAYEWFLGHNELGVTVANVNTGACNDALHADRLNQNQGAESTLAWLISLTEMHIASGKPANSSDVSDTLGNVLSGSDGKIKLATPSYGQSKPNGHINHA